MQPKINKLILKKTKKTKAKALVHSKKKKKAKVNRKWRKKLRK